MTAQALAGALAGVTVVLLAVLLVVELSRRRALLDARVRREELDNERKRHAREHERRLEAGARRRSDLELERVMRRSAEARLEELELDLARRREGPILEGETVALTTPGDRTIRGVVRQVFDNGAVLLGGATVYVERAGRGGDVEVEELDAGDVVVPQHRWAQKLPPAPVQED